MEGIWNLNWFQCCALLQYWSTQLISLFSQLVEKCLLCSFLFWYFIYTFVLPFLATSTAPTVFPLMPCDSETGGMVSLSCLVTGFTPSSLTYTWTKGATALTDFIQYPPVQKGNAYTGVSQVQVRREDWQTRTPDEPLKCVVTHPAGTAQCLFVPPSKTHAKLYINIYKCLFIRLFEI